MLSVRKTKSEQGRAVTKLSGERFKNSWISSRGDLEVVAPVPA